MNGLIERCHCTWDRLVPSQSRTKREALNTQIDFKLVWLNQYLIHNCVFFRFLFLIAFEISIPTFWLRVSRTFCFLVPSFDFIMSLFLFFDVLKHHKRCSYSIENTERKGFLFSIQIRIPQNLITLSTVYSKQMFTTNFPCIVFSINTGMSALSVCS